jgi:lipid II:glycine glycyltransferase (peptidoglycan interpeptide bridge formation enzyme)
VENRTDYCNCLFEQPWWLDLVAPKQWNEEIIKNNKDEVIARIAYVKGEKSIFMPKMTQCMGIWESSQIKSNYGERKRNYYKLFEEINKNKSVEICLNPSNEYVLPFRWMGYRMEPKFTYRINNLSDCNELYSRFNKRAKRNIRCAQKEVKIYTETDLERLWKTLDKTFQAQNRKNPMPKELIYKIVKYCDENDHGKYIEARDGAGNTHSCAYFVYDEKVCYYLIGASDSDFRNSGAQSLVLWEGIQFAAQKSCIFDFEGSMIEGIENFFRQFNSVCTPYYVIRKNGLIKDIELEAKMRIKKIIGYKI